MLPQSVRLSGRCQSTFNNQHKEIKMARLSTLRRKKNRIKMHLDFIYNNYIN